MIFYRLSMNVTDEGMHLLTRVEAMLSHVYNQNELDSDDSSNNEEIISEEEMHLAFNIMQVFSTEIYNCSEPKLVWNNDPRPESPADYYIHIFNDGKDMYLRRGREIMVTMTLYINEIEMRNCVTDTEYKIETNLDIGLYLLSTVTEYGSVEHSFSSIDELLAHFKNSLSIRDGDLSDDDIDGIFFSD